jgi:hypothetical protein
MRQIIRLSVGIALMSAVLLLPSLASPAFGSGLASARLKPVVESSTTAQFVIPAAPAGEWVLREWSYPTMSPPGTLVTQTFGSSGTITVNIPTTANCYFQFDVKVAVGGNSSTPLSSFKWYSGLKTVVQNCGGGGPH